MATADTTAEESPPPTGLAASFPALQRFNQLPPRQKWGMVAAIALTIALLIGSWLWGRQPEYSVLFSNLSDKDGGAITAALTQQQVPYKFSQGGSAILVPQDVVHDVRLRLASQGLPKGGLVGFELMENEKLGISQFAEQVNYQRALEGELARSIQALAAVDAARVHLAIPKQSGFLRDEQKPTASVLVNLRPGRTLELPQVAGVVHLVASSVPELNPLNVTVIDQNGNMLSQKGDPLRNAGLDPTQLKYVQEVERSYIKRIENILTPVVGASNIRAQVVANMDFSQTEQTAETFRPSADPTKPIVRSQQVSESASTQGGATGVPGALSNQPPAPATAPITAPAVSGGSAAGAPLNTKKDATTNYELDKTVQHVKQAVGSIKRLSVAVVVNQKKQPLPDGKTKNTPLTEGEMKQINDLVKEAMGFDAQRGDSLNVTNVSFTPPEKEVLPETPLWKDPETLALAKDAGRWLLVLALAGYLVFGVIRPMVKSVTQTEEERKAEEEGGAEGAERHEPGEAGAEGEEGEAGEEPGAPADSYHQKLTSAREMAKQNPKLVANVIKEWLEGGNG
ncbi:MAG: flagellar basal-body MS-ring/collar protein FliF [Rhodocyclaceae bacterium]|nr:flagellar basal-body MS-ring/collar protein FliF [Rhodocyclaceae bacterium]